MTPSNAAPANRTIQILIKFSIIHLPRSREKSVDPTDFNEFVFISVYKNRSMRYCKLYDTPKCTKTE